MREKLPLEAFGITGQCELRFDIALDRSPPPFELTRVLRELGSDRTPDGGPQAVQPDERRTTYWGPRADHGGFTL